MRRLLTPVLLAVAITAATSYPARPQGDVSLIADVPARLLQVMTSPELGMTEAEALTAYRAAVGNVQAMRWLGPLWTQLSLQASNVTGTAVNWVDAAIRASTPEMEARGVSMLSLFAAQLRALYQQGLRGAALAEAYAAEGAWTVRNMNVALGAWRAEMARRAAAAAAGEAGFVTAEVLVGGVLAILVAHVSYQAGHVVGTQMARQRDQIELIERRTDAMERHAAAMDGLLQRLRQGQVTPVRNLTREQMIQQLQVNLSLGNPPFQGVFERRPCPDLSGGWEGELTIRNVTPPLANLEPGRSRPVRGTAFRLIQEPGSCDIRADFNGSTLDGFFESYVQRTTARGYQEVDYLMLASNPSGNVTNIRIEYYGTESDPDHPTSDFIGQISVVTEQSHRGSAVESAGILRRAGGGPAAPTPQPAPAPPPPRP